MAFFSVSCCSFSSSCEVSIDRSCFTDDTNTSILSSSLCRPANISSLQRILRTKKKKGSKTDIHWIFWVLASMETLRFSRVCSPARINRSAIKQVDKWPSRTNTWTNTVTDLVWPVQQLAKAHARQQQSWSTWIEYVNREREWSTWIKYVNGVREWNTWIEYVNEVRK